MKILFSFLLVLLVAFSAQAKTEVKIHGGTAGCTGIDYTADANCMGAWYMADTGNETDVSTAGTETLTETGGTIPTSATFPAGYSGTSRDFEAGDDESLLHADGGTTDIEGNLTLCAWYRPEGIGTTERIVAKQNNTTNQKQYMIQVGSDNIFDFFISKNGTDSIGPALSTTTRVADTWYHVCGVVDLAAVGDEMFLYINGSEEDTYSAPLGGGEFSANFKVGNSDSGSPSDGLIFQVIIFDRALSSTEIGNIYADGIDGCN